LISTTDLEGRDAVVIDVLRASTSICTALHNGCRHVTPVPTPEQAFELREQNADDQMLLCGERGGKKIDGFDLGNSPSEYTPDRIADKTMIFCSTNGSGAVVKCQSAAATFVGGFINLQVLIERLNASNRSLTVLCSGREGRFALEDTICAGMLVERLVSESEYAICNDAALVARLLYKNYAQNIETAVRVSDHGRYLTVLGFGADISLAVALDSMPVLPVLRDGKLMAE
jgi:2-phosphosulfolactate phosphatase